MPTTPRQKQDHFDANKRNALSKLAEADKSPKGSLDAPIAPLVSTTGRCAARLALLAHAWSPCCAQVHALNRHRDYVTTSSCSGRVALFESPALGRTAGRWLLVEHRTVTADELIAALRRASAPPGRAAEPGNSSAVSQSAPMWREAGRKESKEGWTGVGESSSNASGGVEQGGASGEGAGMQLAPQPHPGTLITFKVEAPILHVQCRTLDSATRLLFLALRTGFRESGIVLSSSSKVMLGIRTTANTLELPFAQGHATDDAEADTANSVEPSLAQRAATMAANVVAATANTLELPFAKGPITAVEGAVTATTFELPLAQGPATAGAGAVPAAANAFELPCAQGPVPAGAGAATATASTLELPFAVRAEADAAVTAGGATAGSAFAAGVADSCGAGGGSSSLFLLESGGANGGGARILFPASYVNFLAAHSAAKFEANQRRTEALLAAFLEEEARVQCGECERGR
jgi:tRNA(Phe) wybutosine-synthesizing methylase Tyw3